MADLIPATGIGQSGPFIPIDHKGESASTHIACLPNEGQLTSLEGTLVPDVAFYSVQCMPQYYLTKQNQIFFQLGARDSSLATPDTIYRIGVEFIGNANTNCIPVGMEELPEAYNFILGHCPNGIYDVHPVRRVLYENIYSNIDLHVYSNPWGPKLYLVLRPGADPVDIKMRFEGQDSLLLDLLGNLHAIIENNTIVLPKGLCYQQIGGTTQLISAGLDYDLSGGVGTVTFDFEPYDPDHPLIIDISASFGPGGPEIYPTPEWCTYDGHTEPDVANDAVALSNGDLVTAGMTYSPSFPLFAAQFDVFQGSHDGFLSYFNNDYERKLTTFYGGNGMDEVNSLALSTDEQSVYLYGRTRSTDLPIISPLGFSQTSNPGEWSCFIAKFSLATATLGLPERSTYFGDPWNTFTCPCIRTDSNGSVYVAGTSKQVISTYPLVNTCTSPAIGFPMCNALGTAAYFQNYGDAGGNDDAYFARFDPQFNLVHSTRFGGHEDETGIGLAVDKDLDLIVLTGWTNSQRRPYTNCAPPIPGFSQMGFPLCDPGDGYFQDALNGSNVIGQSDAYIAGFRISTGALVWSTFVGGGGSDAGLVVEFNKASGSIMLAGRTSTATYSASDCVPPNDGGFPHCGPSLQPYGGGYADMFVTRFATPTLALWWSSFIGGGGYEEVASVRHRFGGQMLLSGWTDSGSNNSPPFPTRQLENIYFKGIHNDAGATMAKRDAFIMVLNETEGDNLKLSTLLGGVGNDVSKAAVSTGYSRIYVAGSAGSLANIPFKCPPTDDPYCYLSYGTVSTSYDVLYAQIMDDITIGIEPHAAEGGLSGAVLIFPNPVCGSFSIDLDPQLINGNMPRSVLYDATGRIVDLPTLQRIGDDRLRCTLGAIAQGSYMLQLSGSDASWTKTAKILIR